MKKLFVILLCMMMLCSGCGKETIYTDGAPDSYSFVESMSQIRVALPDDILSAQLDTSDVTLETGEESLKSLTQQQYCTRMEPYGMITVGPDLYFLTAFDKSLFETDLGKVSYTDELQYLLQNEVELGRNIFVTGSFSRETSENSQITKIICPIQVESFSFADTQYEGKYIGYASMIQKKDYVAAICLATHEKQNDRETEKQLMNRDLTIAQTFRIEDINEFDFDSHYTIYANVLPDCSYETGGLFTYTEYPYYNLGTEKLDTNGTYNNISPNLGMYCLNTAEFGPLNLPYIIADPELTSSVDQADGLKASIKSQADGLTYQVKVRSFGENEDFESLLADLRKQIYNKKMAMSTSYQNQKILSEQIVNDSEAVITLCGWDPDAGNSTTIYYKLVTGKNVYSLTEITDEREFADDINPLLKEVTALSGIILV